MNSCASAALRHGLPVTGAPAGDAPAFGTRYARADQLAQGCAPQRLEGAGKAGASAMVQGCPARLGLWWKQIRFGLCEKGEHSPRGSYRPSLRGSGSVTMEAMSAPFAGDGLLVADARQGHRRGGAQADRKANAASAATRGARDGQAPCISQGSVVDSGAVGRYAARGHVAFDALVDVYEALWPSVRSASSERAVSI